MPREALQKGPGFSCVMSTWQCSSQMACQPEVSFWRHGCCLASVGHLKWAITCSNCPGPFAGTHSCLVYWVAGHSPACWINSKAICSVHQSNQGSLGNTAAQRGEVNLQCWKPEVCQGLIVPRDHSNSCAFPLLCFEQSSVPCLTFDKVALKASMSELVRVQALLIRL
jgi:hypothetical protein